MVDYSPVFEQAIQLINHPHRWTKKAYARTFVGSSVGVRNNAACQWCLTGAIYRAALDMKVPEPVIHQMFQETSKLLKGSEWARRREGRGLSLGQDGLDTLIFFNDDEWTNHRDVVKLLETAYAKAKQEEQ